MSEALHQLVEMVAGTRFEDLPELVIDQAKLVLMDTTGAILAGGQAREVRELAAHATHVSRARDSTIFGHVGKADPGWAGLVNATAGTSTELDEGHAPAKGHPAIHVLPAALALGESRRCTGRDVLTSIVLGYEVAARVGSACDLRPAAHPHGTWGTLGAATAAAKLKGFDAQGIRETINIASSLTLATSFETAYQGALVRNIYAGVSNQMGLFASHLKECGFTGERDGPATVFGRVMSDTFRENALVDGLGERYEISRGYFKSHSCCRYNHAALDALLLLRDKTAFDAAEVTKVEVETYGLAAALHDPHPSTTLAARFSIPYAIAIALIREATSPSAFDETALTDVTIRSLAEKVDVQEVAEYTAMTPERRPARVTVHLGDGRTLSETVYESRGDPGRPFTKQELVEKYLGLAGPVIGEERAGRTLPLMEDFPELQSIRALTELLQGEATSS